MDFLVFLVCCGIVLAVLYDVIVTVISHGGAGPITSIWTKWLWRGVLTLKYKHGIQWPIRMAGPGMLIGIVTVWYLMFYLCWFFMITMGNYAIKNPNSSEAVSTSDVLYFIGSSFSTLGIGDLVPSGPPWTLLTTVGALLMSSLISLSISYFIPVLSAVVKRRYTATQLKLIGATPQDVLDKAWTKPDSNLLNGQVISLLHSCTECAYQAHLYPVLAYFYSSRELQGLSSSVLNVLDAVAVQKLRENRSGNLPDPVLDYIFNTIREFATTSSTQYDLRYEPDISIQHLNFRKLLEDYKFEFSKRLQAELVEILELREQLLRLRYLEGYAPQPEQEKQRLKKAA